MSKKEKEERKEVLALIKQSLYDKDWINSSEMQVIGEKTYVKEIIALDFSGHCLTDLIGLIEEVYGVNLNDEEVKTSSTFGDIVSIVVQQVELA